MSVSNGIGISYNVNTGINGVWYTGIPGYFNRKSCINFNGIPVYRSGNYGIPVYHSGKNGIPVYRSGINGIPVYRSGKNGIPVYRSGKNGIPVYRSGMNGLYHWTPWSSVFY